jgi:hypothetical protein
LPKNQVGRDHPFKKYKGLKKTINLESNMILFFSTAFLRPSANTLYAELTAMDERAPKKSHMLRLEVSPNIIPAAKANPIHKLEEKLCKFL